MADSENHCVPQSCIMSSREDRHMTGIEPLPCVDADMKSCDKNRVDLEADLIMPQFVKDFSFSRKKYESDVKEIER